MYKCTACGYTKTKLNSPPEYQLRRTATSAKEKGEVLCVSDKCCVCQRLTFFAQLLDEPEAEPEATKKPPQESSLCKKAPYVAARSEERRLPCTGPIRVVENGQCPPEPTITFRGLATMPMPTCGFFDGDGGVQEVPATLRIKMPERFTRLAKDRDVSACPQISHPCASPPERNSGDVTVHYRKECFKATGGGSKTNSKPKPEQESNSESWDDLSGEAEDAEKEMESLDTLHRRHNCYSTASSGTESSSHGRKRNTGGLHRTSAMEHFRPLPSFRSVIKIQQTKIKSKQKQIRRLERLKLQVHAEMRKTEKELQQLEKDQLQELQKDQRQVLLEHTAQRQARKQRHAGGAHDTPVTQSMLKVKELKQLFELSDHCKDTANPQADALLGSLVHTLQEQSQPECKDRGTQTVSRCHKKQNQEEKAQDKYQPKGKKSYLNLQAAGSTKINVPPKV